MLYLRFSLSSVMVPRKCLVPWTCSLSLNRGERNAELSSATELLRIRKEIPYNQKFLASGVFRLSPADQVCTLEKIPEVTPQYT